MLSKADRLSIKEFNTVVKTGRETHSPLFSIRYVPANRFKFSPTAPKSTFKTAVLRNRTRRRIYAAARKVISETTLKPNMVVLIVKRDISHIESPQLVSLIRDLFVQARLIA